MDHEFINRKVDHLRIALQAESEAKSHADFDQVRLIHDSLPDLDFQAVHLDCDFLGQPNATPFFIAGMTAGHPEAERINQRLAKAASDRGWLMGLGSQRRELDPHYQDHSSAALKNHSAHLKIISNLGIAQLVELARANDWRKLEDLLARTQSSALAIHLNPLQEVIQQEGTPHFKGAFEALQTLKTKLSIPLILKETGSGMSLPFLKRISALQPFAVDISGLGGTHWGRVEGLRAPAKSLSSELGECFKNWGVSTLQSLAHAREVFEQTPTEIWASGGIRSGLDAAKCLALGATRVGFAKPALEAALQSSSAVEEWMKARETELRVALFCTGSGSLPQLDRSKVESGEFQHG